MSVICDWLTVTYGPDDSASFPIVQFLVSAGATCVGADEKTKSLSFPDSGASLKIVERSNFHSLSASGGFLHHLRGKKLFLQYLTILAGSPHRVSRLDAAYDSENDAAYVLPRLVKRLESEPSSFSRKKQSITEILQRRESDNKKTGTVYLGERSNNVMARVYDKQQQMLKVHNLDIGVCTRYEIEIKQKASNLRPSLRDAAEPDSIFWHYACPTLFANPPRGVTPWVSSDYPDRLQVPVAELLPAVRLDRYIESPQFFTPLEAMIEPLGTQGGASALRAFTKLLRSKGYDV